MKYLIWLAFIFSTLIGNPLFAESIESWSDLKRLINDHQVTTVDELLTRLPKDYTNGFTLIYRTRALHQELVSAVRPRVLLFGQNAKFVITYNSHIGGGVARAGDVESIETLDFDESTGRSVLREVVFDGSVPNLAKVQANPERCLACHGQAPYLDSGLTARGLWDPYNSWSGVYGSLSRQGIDFIKLGTAEHFNILSFMTEKPNNPRYSFLGLNLEKLSELPPSAFIRNYDPTKMHDALTFSDGQSRLPNQMLGMFLADYNFKRVGNILASQDLKTRAAFQYLVKGMSLDENFAKPDIDPQTNATDVNKKIPACLAKINSFLPDNFAKVRFNQFSELLLQKIRLDYAVRKAAVEVDNMGLSKLGAGFDPNDPYDENRGPRALEFDSINASSKLHLSSTYPGLTGNGALFYLFYLMDIPSQDISTAITRGTNLMVDRHYVLSGSTALYYGNSARCYYKAKLKSSVIPYDIKKYCFSEPVEEFFTYSLPVSFYQNQGVPLDPKLNQLSCDELAVKSKLALSQYFRL